MPSEYLCVLKVFLYFICIWTSEEVRLDIIKGLSVIIYILVNSFYNEFSYNKFSVVGNICNVHVLIFALFIRYVTMNYVLNEISNRNLLYIASKACHKRTPKKII